VGGIIKKIFTKRKLFIIVLFFLLAAFSITKEFYDGYYEVKTSIMVEAKRSPTSVDNGYQAAEQVVGIVMVNMQLLKSSEVLRNVVEALHLDEEVKDYIEIAGIKLSKEFSRENKIRIMQDLLEKKLIKITSLPFTNIIEITVKHKKAQVAADIANSLVENYKEWSVGFKHREIDLLIEYLNKEVASAYEKLEVSEDTLRKFEEDNEIIYLPAEIDMYIEKKFTLEEKLRQAKVSEGAIRDQIDLLKNKFKDQVNVKDKQAAKTIYSISAAINPIVQDYEKQLLSLKIELSRLEELYADESPQVKYMKARIVDLELRIEKTIAQLFKSEFSLATLNPIYEELVMEIITKQAELVFVETEKAMVDKVLSVHENKLKSYPKKQMGLARLNRQVKYEEESYSVLRQELKNAQLVRTKDVSQDVKLVSKALVPLRKKGSLKKIFLRCIFSFLFSIFVAMILDLKQVLNVFFEKN